jgi:hypothetical protein
MVAALSVAPQASAHGFRDVLRRIANEASVRQDGRSDRAATTQNGAANGSAIEQNGDNLTASVRQSGDANNAAIRQFGSNSTGSITQNGSGNDACLLQIGRNVNGEIVQNGDNQSTGLLQTRRGSVPIPVETCQSYDRHHAAGLIMQVARRSILGKRR